MFSTEALHEESLFNPSNIGVLDGLSFKLNCRAD